MNLVRRQSDGGDRLLNESLSSAAEVSFQARLQDAAAVLFTFSVYLCSDALDSSSTLSAWDSPEDLIPSMSDRQHIL